MTISRDNIELSEEFDEIFKPVTPSATGPVTMPVPSLAETLFTPSKDEIPDGSRLHVAQLLRARNRMRAAIEEYKLELEMADDFYQKKIADIRRSVEELDGQLTHILDGAGKKKLDTPMGTIYFKTGTTMKKDVILSSDCYEEKITRVPFSSKELKIKHPELFEGYRTLVIRKPSEPDKEEPIDE